MDSLGNVLLALRDLDGAQALYEDSLALAKRLAAADRSSASLQRDIGVSLEKLGNVLVAKGDMAGARALYQQSVDAARRLADDDPTSAVLQRDVLVSMWKLAELQARDAAAWKAIVRRMEDMQRAGTLRPADQARLDEARRRAGAFDR